MRAATRHQIEFAGRQIDYRLVHSTTSRTLRLRVGPNGIEVVQPAGRRSEDVLEFLVRSEPWILNQIQRVERLSGVRTQTPPSDEILFRGRPTRVRVEIVETRSRGNAIEINDDEIVVRRGQGSRTAVARSLESWLRKRARAEIELQLTGLATRLGQAPGRIYVMDQRTKWGNCSSRRNLSFNWRLILAPDFVNEVHSCTRGGPPRRTGSFGEILVDRSESVT